MKVVSSEDDEVCLIGGGVYALLDDMTVGVVWYF